MLAERRIKQTERTMDNTRGQSMKKLLWAVKMPYKALCNDIRKRV